MKILHELKKVIDKKDELDIFLKDNMKALFQHDTIEPAYQMLDTKFISDTDNLVTLAWLALFSGDNMKMVMIIQSIDETKLSSSYVGFYYDIQALSSAFLSIEERFSKNDKAIHILRDSSDEFMLANCYLTRGQLYNGTEQFRNAAESYLKAYKLFLANQVEFPAIISLTNCLINKIRLGEFKDVHVQVQKALLLSNATTSPCWNIISLPLGMVLVQEGTYALGFEELKKAYKAINELKLLHLHGYIEIYLILVTAIMKQFKKTKQYVNQANELFLNRHYPVMKAIVIFGKIQMNETLSSNDIQTIEVAYQKEAMIQNPLIFELLVYLFIRGKTSNITINSVLEKITHYRYTGDRIHLAQMLLFLSEYYVKQNDKLAAKTVLKEYITMYHKNIKAPLYAYKYSFWDIIRSFDSSISSPKKEVDELTPKEQEILECICRGMTNKEIAASLYITVGTVKWHINHIYGKLQVKNRTEAVSKAQKLNII